MTYVEHCSDIISTARDGYDVFVHSTSRSYNACGNIAMNYCMWVLTIPSVQGGYEGAIRLSTGCFKHFLSLKKFFFFFFLFE